MSFVYVASPYSHSDPAVQELRYRQVREYVAHLIIKRIHAFSPIVHGHELALHHDLPKDFAFWRDYSLALLSNAYCLYVYKMPDWEHSIGVRAEIAEAKRLNKPTFYFPFECYKA